MSNIFVSQAIKFLASLLLGSGIFERVLRVVSDWNTKSLSGIEKKEGALSELNIIGIGLSTSLANLAIELAVTFLKNKSK